MASGTPLAASPPAPQLTLVSSTDNILAAPGLPASLGAAGGGGIDTSSMWLQSVEGQLRDVRKDLKEEVEKLGNRYSSLLMLGIGAVGTLLTTFVALYFYLSADIKDVRERQQDAITELSKQGVRVETLGRDSDRLEGRVGRVEDRSRAGRPE
jgi:hypothetical protein